MKSEILALLRQRGDFVSGQELCERFQVSRTAVWKAVGQLKKEGYEIQAVQNKGYLLTDGGEFFGQNELESRMATRWAGHPLTYYETIGSTNLQAKMDAENGAPQGALVVADMQTAGRGRRGRSWNSPPGTNVYFTLLLKPDFSPDQAAMLTPVMALAVAEGIRRTCGLTPGIKWPNDVLIGDKKVCGILAELSVEQDFIHYVVIGVGINVGLQEFPPEVAPKAACLQQECGRRVDRAQLVADVMDAFEAYYQVFLESGDLSGLAGQYNSLLVNVDREVKVLDPKGEWSGISHGITPTGELRVERADGVETLVYAGEVSVRGRNGYV